MPNLTIHALGRTIILKNIDLNQSLAYYKSKIDSALTKLETDAEIKSASSQYSFSHESKILNETVSLKSLGFKDNLTIDAKPVNQVLKKDKKDEIDQRKDTSAEKENLGLKFLFAISDNNLFRIVVDASNQGWDEYEHREKGCIQNVLLALLEAPNFIKKHDKLSKDFHKKIHKICRGSIKELQDIPSGEYMSTYGKSGEFEVKAISSSFNLEFLSKAGLYDMSKFALNYPFLKVSLIIQNLTLKVFVFDDSVNLLNYAPNRLLQDIQNAYAASSKMKFPFFRFAVQHSKEDCELICATIFYHYNKLIPQAKSDDAIIQFIVDCIYDLEHLHPFKDVNLRTNIVIADTLLMQHGFPPISFMDPNMLDGCGKAEFFDIVKKGMLKTLDIIETPTAAHFGFKASVKSKDKEEYAEIIRPFSEAKAAFKSSPLTQEELKETRERINALTSYPAPDWIVYNDYAKQKKCIGNALKNPKIEEEKKQVTFQAQTSGTHKKYEYDSDLSIESNVIEYLNGILDAPLSTTEDIIPILNTIKDFFNMGLDPTKRDEEYNKSALEYMLTRSKEEADIVLVNIITNLFNGTNNISDYKEFLSAKPQAIQQSYSEHSPRFNKEVGKKPKKDNKKDNGNKKCIVM